MSPSGKKHYAITQINGEKIRTLVKVTAQVNIKDTINIFFLVMLHFCTKNNFKIMRMTSYKTIYMKIGCKAEEWH